MDIRLFLDILAVDSTSGRERGMAECLSEWLMKPGAGGYEGCPKCRMERLEVGDGTLNLRLSWGKPRFWFCTHIDTVPPYITPMLLPDRVCGRGSCDAKGQVLAQYTACRELEKRGLTDFGLLLFAGEETGSHGAKAYDRDFEGGEMVLVGEPTDNCMVSASKGTKSFGVTLRGKACHSGYPEYGVSAVDKFASFLDRLRAVKFPDDPLMGPTTWNIGKLSSDNPQNVLSPELSFRLYFRTTPASDAAVQEFMSSLEGDIEVMAYGGDMPMQYTVYEGFPSKTVAFGNDAPRLGKFKQRALCGPGSILTAHTDSEYVLIPDIQKAVEMNVAIAERFFKGQER